MAACRRLRRRWPHCDLRVGGEAGNGAASAIRSARDMLKSVEGLNLEFGAALTLPLRVGIGIHSGPAVIARIGDAERGMRLVALGDTVRSPAGLRRQPRITCRLPDFRGGGLQIRIDPAAPERQKPAHRGPRQADPAVLARRRTGCGDDVSPILVASHVSRNVSGHGWLTFT